MLRFPIENNETYRTAILLGFVVVALLVLPARILHAQTEHDPNDSAARDVPGHVVGAGVGLGYAAVRDQSVSPLGYEGYSVPLGLSYRYGNGTDEHEVEVVFESTGINSFTMKSSVAWRQIGWGGIEYEGGIATQSSVDAGYSYRRRLTTREAPVAIAVTGGLSYSFAYRDYWFVGRRVGGDYAGEAWGRDGHLGIRLGLRGSRDFSFGSGFAGASFLLGGLSLRPAYGRVDNEPEASSMFEWQFHGAHLVSVLDLPLLEFTAGVRLPLLHHRIEIVPCYSARYGAAGEEEVQSFRQQFLVRTEIAL